MIGTPRLPAASLLLACLATPAVVASAAPVDGAEQRHEGVVLVQGSGHLLVQTHAGVDVVTLGPRASARGVAEFRELRAGDRIRYTWRREAAGVLIADTLDVEPVVIAHSSFLVSASMLEQRTAQGSGPVVLDAREAVHHRAGHVPGARSLPAGSADEVVRAALPGRPDAAIVVYGESSRTDEGNALARRVAALGHEDVHVLEGGIRRWIEQDRPLEMDPAAAADAMRERPGLLVLDARAPEEASRERIPGSVSFPPEPFRHAEFDGRMPFPPILIVGTDASDPAPRELAEKIRQVRSQSEVKPGLELRLLRGGLAAWKAQRLPLVRGGEPPKQIPFVAVVEGEIDPAEFARRWAEQGGGAAFLDVRRSGGTSEPWVLKVPLEDLANRLSELPRDREIVTLCAIGQRSRIAAEILRRNGFRARFLRASPGH